MKTANRTPLAIAALAAAAAVVFAAGACGPPGLLAPPPAPAGAPPAAAPPPPPGLVVVRNATVDVLTLHVDGIPVAELPPGGAWEGEVRPGRRDLLAVNPEVDVVHARGVEVAAGRETRWLVRQRQGALLVANGGRRPATVLVDGRALGEVPGGAEQRFDAVPEGRRHLEARGPRGTVLDRASLTVQEGAVTRWAFGSAQPAPPPPALLDVFNDTGWPLTVYADGLALGPVPAGATQRFESLPPGAAQMVARGARGDVLARETVQLAPGLLVRWHVALATCSLRVENRSSDRYVILIDGRHVGPVEPTRAHVYAGIRPGAHHLEARPVEGGVVRTRELHCPPGGELEWQLDPPPRAALDVHNGTAAVLEIAMDGRPLGTIRPGLTTRFQGILPGRHRFEAAATPGAAAGVPPHVRDLELAAGEVAGWSIGPRPAALVVRNGWDEPAIIVVDGRRIGRVEPRSVGRFDELVAGKHTVRADRAGGAPQVAVLTLPEGVATDWEVVPDAPATLRIVNRNAVPVLLRVDDRELGRLQPGAERVLSGLRPGTVRVEARAAGGAADADTLTLAPGAVVIWMARLPDQAALTVVNRTAADVVIDLGPRRLGPVPAGTSRTFGELAPGRHTVRASRPGGPVVAEDSVSLTTGAVASWIVAEAPRARLRVRNESLDRVLVALDGHRLGPVPARGEVVFADLRPGRAVVVAQGLDGRELARAEVVLQAPGPDASFVVRPAPVDGQVVIENHLAVPVRILRERDVLAELPPGARRVVDLPRGDHVLRAYSLAARPALLDSLRVRVGARAARWEIRK
jgi:hypothetical protein